MTRRILRRAAVLERMGWSKSTLYNRMLEGKFRRPIKLGERAVGWPEEWIDEAQDTLIAAAEAETYPK